jgi:hypothetical protein
VLHQYGRTVYSVHMFLCILCSLAVRSLLACPREVTCPSSNEQDDASGHSSARNTQPMHIL